MLIVTENIDTYAQYRFSESGENEYTQYQVNVISELWLPRSLALLIPFVRVQTKDNHEAISSLFVHVIKEMRCLQEGFDVEVEEEGGDQKN